MQSVVFLDLDGTFWEMGAVPDSALAAIRAAQANGHLVLSNTGRTRSETQDLAPYGLDGWCFGAGSEVFLRGERIIDHPLGIPTAHLLRDLLESQRINYLLEGSERCYRRFFDKGLLEQIARETAVARAAGDPFLDCADFDAVRGDEDFAQAYKYSVFCRTETSADTVRDLPDGFVFTPLGTGGEITRRGISKATALDAVRSKLDGAWRTVALGDSNNDVPMLRAADVGVCMGNGNDAARAAADLVTSSIHDDGLAHAFEKLGLT